MLQDGGTSDGDMTVSCDKMGGFWDGKELFSCILPNRVTVRLTCHDKQREMERERERKRPTITINDAVVAGLLAVALDLLPAAFIASSGDSTTLLQRAWSWSAGVLRGIVAIVGGICVWSRVVCCIWRLLRDRSR